MSVDVDFSEVSLNDKDELEIKIVQVPEAGDKAKSKAISASRTSYATMLKKGRDPYRMTGRCDDDKPTIEHHITSSY